MSSQMDVEVSVHCVWSQTCGLIFCGLTIEAAAGEIIPKYALKMHFFPTK